jgi:NADH-ubiquinone oxidoreductase chain 2
MPINISDMEYINSLKGLFIKNPILSLSLAICLFSFAGVPPLVGFFAKQQVLYSSNSAGFFFLSLIAILVSVISAFYYLKIIKIIFSMPALSPIKHQYSNFFNSTANIVQNSSLAHSEGGEKKKINNKLEIFVNLLLESTLPFSQESGKTSPLPTGETKEIVTLSKKGTFFNNINLVSNIHSLLIGTLTMFIINFIFNPIIILNSIAIIVANSLSL